MAQRNIRRPHKPVSLATPRLAGLDGAMAFAPLPDQPARRADERAPPFEAFDVNEAIAALEARITLEAGLLEPHGGLSDVERANRRVLLSALQRDIETLKRRFRKD